MQKRILFYYLSAFSQTGGIEKFNRCFIKALNELSGEGFETSIVSVHDNVSDKRYNTHSGFRGFSKERGRSISYILKASYKNDVLILGHINLAMAGVLVKLLRPQCKVILVAHGIEVWDKLFLFKKWCLQKADMILSVSTYTKNQLVLRNGVSPRKIFLFPNTIDPFFDLPATFKKPAYLIDRYKLQPNNLVILTLSRLVSSEQYKGYDKIIAAMHLILKAMPNAVYMLAGKYDTVEKKRIDDLILSYDLHDKIIMTGYIADNEVADHYQLADVFVMPSRKEGFGIVFLEALACGTPVIGGNQDGTVEALLNGSMGVLINPTRQSEIAESIIEQLKKGNINPKEHQERVLAHYRFNRYKERLRNYLKLCYA
jgi:phosphatidyl-myo-inositol dimannoside synthase